MSVALGVLALFFAALLILSIRKNSKIYALLRKSEERILKLKSDNEKLKTALRFGIEALQNEESENCSLKIQNARLKKR
ncbi:MAG: hypothetical protein KH703_01790 [Campylobacter gracilis]|uniref:hypothetical protein n=1 Tax=Campylobacter gracilis TaxID=824 RepID=UPI0026F1909D|nr:hypothetical protein [Campylobacter gracilis]MBS6152138.1 hypothetical protein [Campylobacter gracilis]